jgi:hypothetical protein
MAEILIALLFVVSGVALMDARYHRHRAEQNRRMWMDGLEDIGKLSTEISALKRTLASYEYVKSLRTLKEDGPRKA